MVTLLSSSRAGVIDDGGLPPKGSTAPVDSTVTVYVNDKMFDTFDVAPNSNRKIGFGFQTESSGVEFRNLVVTK